MRAAWLVLLTGCLGETEVSYQGTVRQDDVAGHVFSKIRDSRSPIAAATVELLLDGAVAQTETSRADGFYPILSVMFPYQPGHDHVIEVRATALDGRAYTYRAVYEDTSDPTYSIACVEDEPTCPPTFLEIRLAP